MFTFSIFSTNLGLNRPFVKIFLVVSLLKRKAAIADLKATPVATFPTSATDLASGTKAALLCITKELNM